MGYQKHQVIDKSCVFSQLHKLKFQLLCACIHVYLCYSNMLKAIFRP